MGAQGPKAAFSRADPHKVIRPPSTAAPAEQAASGSSVGARESRRRVGFGSTVVVEVPNWKRETGEMNYRDVSVIESRVTGADEGNGERMKSITLAPSDPSNDGLSHHGEAEQEEEVIVIEEPREERQEGPRVVRVRGHPRRRR